MKSLCHVFSAACALAVLSPAATPAQLIPSEKASVAQTVDGTRITVEYSRPRSRGRDSLIYGTMEPWGRAWTPGADDATTLDVSKPVRILGKHVPAGKYSVWLVLRQAAPWTLVLDPRANLFHTRHPDSTAQQIRAPVMPHDIPHTEVLTWSVPVVDISGATLEMRWGTRGVTIPIEITPTFPLTISATDAAPYLGEYALTSEQPALRFTVVMRGAALIGRRQGDGSEPVIEYQLLPIGSDRFVQGEMVRGELWRTNAAWILQFERANGRVTGFEMMREGRRIGTGERR